MKHWWWKIAAVVLLLSASIAGLWVPLSPALVHVHPDRLEVGPTKITVTGYNTRFGPGAYLRILNDGVALCPMAVEVSDPTHLRFSVDVPEGLKGAMSDLVVNDLTYTGAFYTAKTSTDVVPLECDDGVVPAQAEAGFTFPNRSILYESIRNLHFHVPMWFTMIVLMGISVWHSVKGLGGSDLAHDRAAVSAVHVGLLFCGLGLVTGAVWARATWGAFWTNDVKLNGAAVTALIYLAYLVLRGSIPDPAKRARLSGIYNVFAFVLLVLFLFVVPRLNAIDSLHPGNGGNSGFNDLDLDNRLRLVFYPAVLGWILLGVWMYDLRTRASRLAEQMDR
jgi:heme exporter protein C